MTLPILSTKLYIPPARRKTVARARLVARLNAGLHNKLTVVSAPAGFGKTTLVSEWLSGCGLPVAWLSLDEDDNDPARFLTYCILAIQTVRPDVGGRLLTALKSPQPPATESILAALLNDIAARPDDFIFALDDYHVIESGAVDHALTFLLNQLPPQMHVVITTRADPPLPLARLRAHGQLTEIRAADLRFTLEEAVGFFHDVMGLALPKEDIAALDARIEGWAVGLQLAALALHGTRDDAKSFIASFGGSHRFVLDYLAEEVLNQQPAHIQRFLLQTALLDRLCGDLCDAVLTDANAAGQDTLNALERANLFLIPLDNERKWYRYHHLFADLLRQRLLTTSPEAHLNALHIRASQWYEANGLELEAFHHAAAGQDIQRAERLMDGSGIPLHLRGAAMTVLNWLDSLPSAVLDARPWLWLRSAGLMLVNGQTTGVEAKLQATERGLQSTALLADEAKQHMRGRMAVARATLALTRYDVDTMLAQSRYALEHLAADNLSSRATALWAMGHAYLFLHDYPSADPPLQESIRLARQCGDTFTVILSTIGAGLVQEGQNQMHRAAEIYQSVLQLVGDQPLQIIAEVHLGLARIYYQWNDLDAAEHHAKLSLELAHQYDHIIDRFVIAEVFLVLLKLARGDVEGAGVMLAQTHETAQRKGFTHRMAEIVDMQTRLRLRRGEVEAAFAGVQTHDLPLGRARVHVADSQPAAALDVLMDYRQRIEEARRPDEWLRLLVLQAMALHANGRTEEAQAVRGEAWAIAQPQGIVRLFLDEGPAMAEVFRAIPPTQRTEDVQRLLAAFDAESGATPSAGIDALTERELDVLRLVAEGLSNREISERLFLALDTIKGYNRRIFEKLHVQRRTEAVARARDLGLV